MTPEQLNAMLPRAAVWAEQQERFILLHRDSLALTSDDQAVARRAGVQRPEAIRVLPVVEIPLPEEADLRQAAGAFNLITPATDGMTIGHGIFIKVGCLPDRKLIAHEIRHVAQYEHHGSILAFLQRYLWEVNEYTYPANPMEQEAIKFADSEFPDR